MKKEKLILLIPVMAAPLLVLLYLILWPSYGQYFPKCIFNQLTGLYCPGCGSQRAVVALIHFDFVNALHNNILAVVALPLLLYAFIIQYLRTFHTFAVSSNFFYKAWFAKTVLAAVIVFFVFRNIPVSPFNLLAPVG